MEKKSSHSCDHPKSEYGDQLNLLCGFPLILREEHTMKVFKNRMLRQIFGSKRDETVGGWRKLHNEDLHNLYSSLNIITLIKSSKMR
jgi:hypothetical protein